MAERTTSTGTTVRIENTAHGALVILDNPAAPSDMRNLEAGRLVDREAFQPAPFAAFGLRPEVLRLIADLIEETPVADAVSASEMKEYRTALSDRFWVAAEKAGMVGRHFYWEDCIALADVAAAVLHPDVERLAAERAAALVLLDEHRCNARSEAAYRRAQRAEAEVSALNEELAAGDASDGYHTHTELYEFRMLYNAAAAAGWLAAGIPVVKSRKHSDGEACFGGGWFIVTATLSTGQVSNHYRDEHWDLFAVPEVDLPPEFDGHTPADVTDRLRALLLGAR